MFCILWMFLSPKKFKIAFTFYREFCYKLIWHHIQTIQNKSVYITGAVLSNERLSHNIPNRNLTQRLLVQQLHKRDPGLLFGITSPFHRRYAMLVDSATNRTFILRCAYAS